jgi:hypothetical protein
MYRYHTEMQRNHNLTSLSVSSSTAAALSRASFATVIKAGTAVGSTGSACMPNSPSMAAKQATELADRAAEELAKESTMGATRGRAASGASFAKPWMQENRSEQNKSSQHY